MHKKATFGIVFVIFMTMTAIYFSPMLFHSVNETYSLYEFEEKSNIKFYDVYNLETYLKYDELVLLSQEDIEIICQLNSGIELLENYRVDMQTTEYKFVFSHGSLDDESNYEKYTLQNGDLYIAHWSDNTIYIFYYQDDFGFEIFYNKNIEMDKEVFNEKIVKYVQSIEKLHS